MSGIVVSKEAMGFIRPLYIIPDQNKTTFQLNKSSVNTFKILFAGISPLMTNQ